MGLFITELYGIYISAKTKNHFHLQICDQGFSQMSKTGKFFAISFDCVDYHYILFNIINPRVEFLFKILAYHKTPNEIELSINLVLKALMIYNWFNVNFKDCQ